MEMKRIILCLLVVFTYQFVMGQQNVGVGTLTPNPNAVLEIESNDKGLLIPRLTSAQRNIFGLGLTNTENSMLVYDVNDSIFYYWKATVWIPIPGVNTDDQNIDSVILNPDSTLTIYIEDGTSALVDIKSSFDNTDNQNIDSVVLNPDSTLTVYIEDGTSASVDVKSSFDNTDNQNVDSVILNPDSTLTVYIENGTSSTVNLKELYSKSGEWNDADSIGMNGFVYAKQAMNTGTADTVVVTDNGDFGIGLANPIDKLQIDGSVRIGRVSDGGAVQPAGPGDALYFSGGPDVSGIFDTDNSDWIGMGRFNLASDVSELRIRLGDNQGVVNNDAFVIGSALIGFHPWNEYFRVQSNGFVHIGTSTMPAYPTNQLHLQGEINPLRVEGIQPGTSTDSILTIDATGVIKKIPNSIRGEWNDADSVGMTGFIYAKQALNNGTNDTVVVSDDGKIGIGLAAPLADLHISNITGKSEIRLETDLSNTNPEDDNPAITFYQDGSLVKGYLGYLHGTYTAFSQPVFGAKYNSFLSLANDLTNGTIAIQYAINDTVAMTIDNNRNVGIGTNSPVDKLQINGNVRVGIQRNLAGGAVDPEGWGNQIHFSGGPDVSPGFNSDNSDGFWIGRYNISSDLSDLRIRLGDNEGTANNDAFVIGSAKNGVHSWKDYFRVQSNGFVSIGNIPTTYPTNQLHVNATANPLRLEGLQDGATTDSLLSANTTGVVRKVAPVDILPAGMITPFATAAAPAGWVVADGSAISRATYARLFAAIGTMYGPGDGVATFNLPDYRGQFLRGVTGTTANDPDATTRTNRGDGTTGNNVGTKQQDEFNSHNHELKTSSGGAGVHITLADSPLNDGVGWEQTAANAIPFAGAPPAITYNQGGNETRPVNVYVLYCIKY